MLKTKSSLETQEVLKLPASNPPHLNISEEQLANTTKWLKTLIGISNIDSKFAFIYIYILTINSLIISLTREDYKDSSIMYTLQSHTYCNLHGCDTSCKSELIYRVYLIYSEREETYSIVPNTRINIYFQNCKKHISFKISGIYTGNNELIDCSLEFKEYSYYKGSIKEGLPIGEGIVKFNKGSINTFTGQFDASGKSVFGTIYYDNGCEYKGFVNSLFESNGEGTMDYANQKKCACCSNGISTKHKKREEDEFKMFNIMFDKICGIWKHDTLLLQHELTNSCECDGEKCHKKGEKCHKKGEKCPNKKVVVCLVCEKYYCQRCYLRHKIKFKYDYHNIFRFNDTDCIDTLNSYLLSKEKQTASTIMKQLTIINTELKCLESLPNSVKTQSKKKKKKKKKIHSVEQPSVEQPSVDITTIDGETFFDTREESPIAPGHAEYDASFDDLLTHYKEQFNSDLTHKPK